MMGSVVKSFTGGGSSKGSSTAINNSAAGVAKAAQEGGQTTSAAITNASNTSANSILQGTQTAANGSMYGAHTAANYQANALQYLADADRLPTTLRNSALNSLGNLYNGSGSITDRAMASPLYKAAVQQGENSVLRNASATGGLRSGNANEALAQVNQNALIAAYNDQVNGLQGLSSLPSNANNIAAYMSGIGNTLGQGEANYGQQLGQGQVAAAQTQAQGQISSAQAIANANNAAATAVSQGQIAAAQNSAQSSQNSTNNMFGLAGLGMQAFSTFSDRRLKSDIRYVGNERGHRKYTWTWNKAANAMGLHGASSGVMADEAEEIMPDAVSIRDGYLVVDYKKLGVSHGL